MCSPFSPGADSHPLPGVRHDYHHILLEGLSHILNVQVHCYQRCRITAINTAILWSPSQKACILSPMPQQSITGVIAVVWLSKTSFGVFRVLTDIGTLEAQLLRLKLPWECGWNLFGTKPHPPYAIVVSWGNSNLSILSGNSIVPVGIRCCRGECLQYVSGSSAAHRSLASHPVYLLLGSLER